jgi:hypothetical protein
MERIRMRARARERILSSAGLGEVESAIPMPPSWLYIYISGRALNITPTRVFAEVIEDNDYFRRYIRKIYTSAIFNLPQAISGIFHKLHKVTACFSRSDSLITVDEFFGLTGR